MVEIGKRSKASSAHALAHRYALMRKSSSSNSRTTLLACLKSDKRCLSKEWNKRKTRNILRKVLWSATAVRRTNQIPPSYSPKCTFTPIKGTSSPLKFGRNSISGLSASKLNHRMNLIAKILHLLTTNANCQRFLLASRYNVSLSRRQRMILVFEY